MGQPPPPAQGDACSARIWLRALQAMRDLHDMRDTTLHPVVARWAADRPAAPVLIGRGSTLSYAELATLSNRVARWGLAQGWGAGDVIGLLMSNAPAYPAIWLGLTRIGCTVALLNTHIRGPALAHCLAAAGAKAVIAAPGFASGEDASPHVAQPITWHRCDAEPFSHIDGIDLRAFPAHPITEAERKRPGRTDCALLIYTSGTTGLPKAARITHGRIMEWAHWFAAIMDAAPPDRLYDCLPMYHSVGGVVAVGAMLVAGGAVVVRDRFSASNFWEDVARSECTIVQYIGELCRYLLRADAPQGDIAHRVRLFCGNGLARDVWIALQARFAIPRIIEFYAATEANISLYNLAGRPGAIGHVPGFLAHRFPIALIRLDEDAAAPMRGAAGRCIRCAIDEPGEAISPIGDGDPTRRFDGYVDPVASEKKILRDVFEPGDRWYRTGDLMRRDQAGFFYFIDRLGDTFRYQGENVSTTELAAIVSAHPAVADAVAFGVAVPGVEGRVGMLALACADEPDLAALRAFLHSALPRYARPRFLRICRALDRTGTYRLQKTLYAREGYLASNGDAVWMDDDEREAFVPVDATLLAALRNGELRL